MITDSLLTFDSDVDTQNFVVLSSTFVARKFKDAFFWSASYLVADTSNGKRRAEHNIDNPFRLLESRYRFVLVTMAAVELLIITQNQSSLQRYARDACMVQMASFQSALLYMQPGRGRL